MTERRTKMWGNTSCLLLTDRVQVEFITVRPTGFCSIHRHVFKDNMFVVVRGALTVRWGWEEDECLMSGAPSAEVLTPETGAIVIPKMVIHQFINQSEADVTALEIYRPNDGMVVEPQDIERFSRGGVH